MRSISVTDAIAYISRRQFTEVHKRHVRAALKSTSVSQPASCFGLLLLLQELKEKYSP